MNFRKNLAFLTAKTSIQSFFNLMAKYRMMTDCSTGNILGGHAPPQYVSKGGVTCDPAPSVPLLERHCGTSAHPSWCAIFKSQGLVAALSFPCTKASVLVQKVVELDS